MSAELAQRATAKPGGAQHDRVRCFSRADGLIEPALRGESVDHWS